MQKDTYQNVPILQFADIIKKQHAKKRIQCLLIGNFGAYNIGDEAILAGALIELAKIPNLKVTVAAENPNEVKRLHGPLKAISLSGIRKEIKKSDFVLIGGGGIFVLQYLTILSVLLWKQRIFKKKMYILGLELSSKTHFAVKLLAYPLIKGATLVTARDQITAELLKKNRIHVHVFKDQSIFIEPAPLASVLQDPYFKRFYKKNRLNIGLSLQKPLSKKDEKVLLTEMVAFIDKNQVDADFWFYISDRHPKRFNDERFGHILHEAVKKKVGKDVQFHFIPTVWNPQTYFSSIKLMNIMIAMCPTTVLFAYRNNINIVSVLREKESMGYLGSIGKDVFKIADLTAKKLQTRLLQ